MTSLADTLAIARQYHQAGQLQAAEQLYGQILAVDPNEANAWHLLGVLNAQLGRHQAGVECLHRAIAVHPEWPEALYNLARVLIGQRKFDEAAAHLQRAVELKPDYVEACDNLGFALRAQGRLEESVACHRRAIALRPNFAAAHHNLGLALQELRKLDEAESSYLQALQLNPNLLEAHNNLGNVYEHQKKPAEAEACYRRALALKPDHAMAMNHLGLALQAQGKMEEAVACHRRALELKPRFAAAHHNLGLALRYQGKLDEAVACYGQALEIEPDFIESHINLGNVLQEQGKFDDAAACFRRALELRPDFAETHAHLGDVFGQLGKPEDAVAAYRRAETLNPDASYIHCGLGNVLGLAGRLEEAAACYRRALELKPDYAEAHSSLLCTLQYRDSVTLKELADAHAAYEQRHCAGLRAAWRPHENVRDPERPLRLGFVSCDLHRHPVGYFLIRLLENLDPTRCEAIVYHSGFQGDDLTVRLRAAAGAWRNVARSTDEQLAELVRRDRIDILFDLSGHTTGNRLLAFARKPAPVQVTWAGYVGTTGVAAMDYILADRYEIPSQSEQCYRERVLRMPDGYVCYDPPEYAPPVSPLPALENGYVTFAAFHNPPKLTLQVVAIWAQLLRRLPDARLLLKYRGMDDASVSTRLANVFADHGIDPERIEFLGYSTHGETLAQYHRVDLALDSFPYNGGLTTCEALWMGVPVVTCPGETFAGRHSLSHLSNVGLTETIAGDLQQYVEVAVSLASDLPRLATLRAGLRERMAASPLCDGKRFADNFAEVLRGAWRDWCEEDSGLRVQGSDSHYQPEPRTLNREP